MRKLLAGRFVWEVKFPSDFQDNLCLFLTRREEIRLKALL